MTVEKLVKIIIRCMKQFIALVEKELESEKPSSK